MSFKFTGAAITGVGMSKVGRNTMRPCMDLLLDATFDALESAGLTKNDIDGICTYPGVAERSPGMSPLGTGDLRNALGINTNWHCAMPEGAAQAGAIMSAAMAVATGVAKHIIVFRALTESSSQSAGRRASVPSGNGEGIKGWLSYLLPMNAMSATNWAAMFATRYKHDFGFEREDFAQIALIQRENALKNPRAFMQKPLSLEEYMGARMISEPLCLFDCDVPIDGACVIIVSALDAAKDCKNPPLVFEAIGSALCGIEAWDQQKDLTTMASHDAGKHLWSNTDFKPKDVQVAGLYDGFSIFVPMWLEALGICEQGTAVEYIKNGNTKLDGKTPVNTGGGQLSAGRLHGFGLLHEVCTQMWKQGGARQVNNDAQIGVVGMGGGPLAGAILLRRD